MADHVVLVGMMGVGKTSVGRRVAEALDRIFIDTDAEIEHKTGRTASEIFASFGEAGFRRFEVETISEVVVRDEPAVIAVGGGGVIDPRNREQLSKAGTVVWLTATPDTLASRVRSGGNRPLLVDDYRETLETLCTKRRAFYDEVAEVTIEVDDLSTEQVAECILAALA